MRSNISESFSPPRFLGDGREACTQEESVAFVDVQAPLPEVVVHLHRRQNKILVNILVDGVHRVEPRIVEHDVTCKLGQSADVIELYQGF